MCMGVYIYLQEDCLKDSVELYFSNGSLKIKPNCNARESSWVSKTSKEKQRQVGRQRRRLAEGNRKGVDRDESRNINEVQLLKRRPDAQTLCKGSQKDKQSKAMCFKVTKIQGKIFLRAKNGECSFFGIFSEYFWKPYLISGHEKLRETSNQLQKTRGRSWSGLLHLTAP